MKARGNLLFVANFGANVGYAWTHIERLFAMLADRMSHHGVRTFVSYPRMEEPPETLRGSAAIPVELDATLGNGRSCRATMRFIRQHEITTVYLTDRPYWSPRYALLRVAGVRRLLVHDRISGKGTPPRGWKRWAKWVVARLPWINADVIIAVSDFVARRGVEVARVPRDKVVRVYNGFRVPANEGAPKTRATFDLAPDTPVVAAASRAAPEKGIHHLLRAFDRMLDRRAEEGPSPVLIYLGDGPQLEDLRALRERLPSRENVLLGGYRPQAVSLLRGADLFVTPSVWEDAFPSSVLEPMSYGKPVIATRVGGVPEMIEDGRCGLLVPPADEDALADAMERLLGDPEEAARLGRAARKRVESHFTLERQVEELTRILEGQQPPTGLYRRAGRRDGSLSK